MKQNELQEQIEAWLNHTMDPETRQAWEQRLADDSALRQEIALHQQMQQDFDAGRLHLRANLRNILNEPLTSEAEAKSDKRRRWLPVLLLLGIVVGTIWVIWHWGRAPQAATPTVLEGPQLRPPAADTVLVAPKQERPIAMLDPARFKPNPSMEALVKSKMRSESIEVKLIRPVNGTRLVPDEKGKTKMRFTGNILMQTEAAPPEFVLSFFDNTNTSKPVLETPVSVKNEGENDLKFDFQQGMSLLPGLYYFTLESLDEGEVLYAGKFSIVPR